MSPIVPPNPLAGSHVSASCWQKHGHCTSTIAQSSLKRTHACRAKRSDWPPAGGTPSVRCASGTRAERPARPAWGTGRGRKKGRMPSMEWRSHAVSTVVPMSIRGYRCRTCRHGVDRGFPACQAAASPMHARCAPCAGPGRHGRFIRFPAARALPACLRLRAARTGRDSPTPALLPRRHEPRRHDAAPRGAPVVTPESTARLSCTAARTSSGCGECSKSGTASRAESVRSRPCRPPRP